MGRILILGLAMILVAGLIGLWIMTSPRGIHWQIAQGAEQYRNAVADAKRSTMVRTGTRQTFKASVEERIPADRSQIYLTLEAEGATTSDAMAQIGAQRSRLATALAAAGHTDAILNDNDVSVVQRQRTKPQTAQRETYALAKAQIAVTFEGIVDFVDLLSMEDFAEVAAIEQPLYWIADRDAALSAVEAEAAENARAKARRAMGEQTFEETGITFKNTLRAHGKKYRSPSLRIVVTAEVTVWATVRAEAANGRAEERSGVVRMNVGPPPQAVEVNVGPAPSANDILDGHRRQRYGSTADAD